MVQTRSSVALDSAGDNFEAQDETYAGFSDLCDSLDSREPFLQSRRASWDEFECGGVGTSGVIKGGHGQAADDSEDDEEPDMEEEEKGRTSSGLGAASGQEQSDQGDSMIKHEDTDSAVDSDDKDEFPATGARILSSLPAWAPRSTGPPLTIKIRPSAVTASQQQPQHEPPSRSLRTKSKAHVLLKKRLVAKVAHRTGKSPAKHRDRRSSPSKEKRSAATKKVRAAHASFEAPVKWAKKSRPPIFDVNDLESEWCDIKASPEPESAPLPTISPPSPSPVKRGRGRPPTVSKEVVADLTQWSVLAYVSVEEPPRVVQKSPRASKRIETPDGPPKGPFTITHKTEWPDLLRSIAKYAGILQENFELETLRWSVFPPSTSAKVQSAANMRWLPIADDVGYQDFVASGIKTTKGTARFIFSLARPSPTGVPHTQVSRLPYAAFDGRLFPGSPGPPFHESSYVHGASNQQFGAFPYPNQHAPPHSSNYSYGPDPSSMWHPDLDNDLSDDGGSPTKKSKKSSKKDKGTLLVQLQPLVDFLQAQYPVGCCGLNEHSDFACYYDGMRRMHFKLDKNRFQVWAYEITKGRATTEMLPRQNKFFVDKEAVKPLSLPLPYPSMAYAGYEHTVAMSHAHLPPPTGSQAAPAWTPPAQYHGNGSGPASGGAAPAMQYYPGMPMYGHGPAVQPAQYGQHPTYFAGHAGAGTHAGGPAQGLGMGSGYAHQPAIQGYMAPPNRAYQFQPHATYQMPGAGPSHSARR
ncbi:hypothetical protein K466DRAFT_654170 [Polyporus arcularius HHB13444]|uniref:Uncharacterized protein n=1 Tax=Polyporus arcularius HHB13444 TaxID=1314778 RepID=A0A5C3P7E5_9APHY|nr:hypothetical protein K466DRAFT_654170 [Polyporus arcularius HHB13444]